MADEKATIAEAQQEAQYDDTAHFWRRNLFWPTFWYAP